MSDAVSEISMLPPQELFLLKDIWATDYVSDILVVDSSSKCESFNNDELNIKYFDMFNYVWYGDRMMYYKDGQYFTE